MVKLVSLGNCVQSYNNPKQDVAHSIHPTQLPLCSSVFSFFLITNLAATDQPGVIMVVPCLECFWQPSIVYQQFVLSVDGLLCSFWFRDVMNKVAMNVKEKQQLFQFITISWPYLPEPCHSGSQAPVQPHQVPHTGVVLAARGFTFRHLVSLS